ncbi:MAG TPA: lipid kinase YegS [Xanthomonadaceae bacterium]|nr:lipid kinase YegS [Xanthomonadaceae bacterium]
MRWRLVINGKAAGDEPLRDAVAAMRADGEQVSVRVTWEAGDAERYVAEAIADGVDTVIAAGGDGTLSEVATTLAHRDEAADALPSLALVPLGTANDFAAAAGVPLDPHAALAVARDSPARAIDLLRIDSTGSDGGTTTHWCANLASGGFGTQVTVATNEGLKKILGGLAYLLTGIASLGRIDPIQARIRGPGFDWTGGFIALGIGNGRQAGGGQVLCPGAVIDDDLLELTVVPSLEGTVGATLMTLFTRGREAALDRVAVRAKLPWVDLASDTPFVLNLDGEPVESTRFRIECVAGRVRMHLPEGCPLLLECPP